MRFASLTARLVVSALLLGVFVSPVLDAPTAASASPSEWRAPVSAADSLTQSCGTVAVFLAGATGDAAVERVSFGIQTALGDDQDVRVVQLNDVLPSADAFVQALAGAASTVDSDAAIAAWNAAADDWSVALADASDRCAESIVVIGFGEHAAAAEYALAQTSPAASIGGIVLLSNPLRSLEDPSGFEGTVIGDAGVGDGLLDLMVQRGFAPTAPTLPVNVRDHVIDGCVSFDYVCDSSSLLVSEPDLALWLNSPLITVSHLGYGTEDSVLDAPTLQNAGGSIAARLDSLRVTPRVAVEVNQYVTSTIDLEPLIGAGNGMEQWRLLGSFPESMYAVLSGFGSLIVSPEWVGRSDVRLEHREQGGAWVQAWLELTVNAAPAPSPPGQPRPAYPPVPSGQAAEQACANFMFVGARGSGQPSTEATGYGGEVASIRDGIIDGMASDTTVREVWLDYTAAPVPDFNALNWSQYPGYLDSIRDGTEEMISLLVAERRRCSAERWIVAGYSQGALVARNALSSVEVTTDRLAKAVLIADPGRRRLEFGVENLGSANAALDGFGIAVLGYGFALPAQIWNQSVHLCNEFDIVCDHQKPSLVPDLLHGGTPFGVRVHESYVEEYPLLYAHGKQFADQIGGSGYSPADDNQLITGSIKRVINSTPSVVRRGEGQEALWIRCNSYLESCMIMSSAREPGSTVWSQPTEVIEVPHNSVNLNALSTAGDRTLVTWAVPEPDPTSSLWFPYGQQVKMNQIKSMVRVGDTWSDPVDVTTNPTRDYQIRLATGSDGSVALVTMSQGSCLSAQGILCSTVSTDEPRLFRVDVAFMSSQATTFGPLHRVTPAEAAIWGLEAAVLDNGAAAVAWEANSDRQIHVSIVDQGGATLVSTTLPEIEVQAPQYVVAGGLKAVTANGNQAHIVTARSVQASFFSSQSNEISTLSLDGELSVETLPTTVDATFRAFDMETRDIVLRQNSYSSGGSPGAYLDSSSLGAGGDGRSWSPLSRHAEGATGIRDLAMTGAPLNSDGDLGVVAYHVASATAVPTFDFHVLPSAAEIWSKPRAIPLSWRPGDGANATSVSAGDDGITSVLMLRAPLNGSTQYFMQSFVPDLTPRAPRQVTVSLASLTGGAIVAGQTVTLMASVASIPPRLAGGAGAVGYYELYSGATLLATSTETVGETYFTVRVPQGGQNSFTAVWLPLDDTHVQFDISDPLELWAERVTPTIVSNVGESGSTGAPTDLSIAVSGELSVPSGSVTVTLTPDVGQRVTLDDAALDEAGAATVDIPQLPRATYSVEITYSGNATYIPRTVAGTTFTVTQDPPPRVITGATPTISGGATVGSRLTAEPGDWTPAEVTLTYQWKRSGTNIPGATSTTYETVTADIGEAMTVEVRGELAGAEPVTVTSLPVLVASPPPIEGSAPIIDGSPTVGSTLTTQTGTWTPSGVTFEFQWFRNGVPIVGATDAAYTVGAADIGASLRVEVTGSLDGRADVIHASVPTETVVLPPAQSGQVAGVDRYGTSVSISQQAFPTSEIGTGVPELFVASGANFPDALSAGPVVSQLGGPVLLTKPNTLPSTVRDEIIRLKPNRIAVIGGVGAVSEAVFSQLQSLAPTVVRLGGATRYETSRIVTSYGFGEIGAEAAYIAAGEGFADALAAGAAAGSKNAPIVLVPGKSTSVDEATLDLLRDLGVSKIFVVGGEGAVSVGVHDSLKTVAPVTRLAGKDRMATAQAVNREAFDDARRVYLAYAFNFPDALGGGVLATVKPGPLFTVPSNCVPSPVLAEIRRVGATEIVLLGGSGVLGPGVLAMRTCI